MSEAEKTIGIFTGVLDVYVARYATEDTTAAAPTYDPPKVLGASIEVTITPDEAVNNGGKWRIQGEEAWRESGTYAAVPGGKEYTVEFLEAAGYTTPAVQKKTPAAGKVEKVTGTYVVKSE